MKKLLFALALAACFAFGASECEKYEKECNDGNMESCLRAALQYEDNTKTLKLLEKTCDGGYEPGCLVMSIRMMQENPKKGIEYHEKRCDAGDAMYCGLLGSMYSSTLINLVTWGKSYQRYHAVCWQRCTVKETV